MEDIAPKISIIVPVYNIEQYLNQCIDSILAQTFTDFELLLIDDGSPDNSGQICDEYTSKDSRIKVIHQKNGGVISARKTGVLAAQGEWIFFVDGDDKVEIDGLRVLVKASKLDETLDIIEGSYTWFYPDGTTKQRPNRAKDSNPIICDAIIYAKGLYEDDLGSRGPWGKIIRKNILLESDALKLPRTITNREDTMMLTAVARKLRKYMLLGTPVYLYRNQFGVSAVSNNLSWKYWGDYLQYMHDTILKGVEQEWYDVWEVTVEDIFKIAFHGNTSFASIPTYYRKNLVPVLRTISHRMPASDKLLIWALQRPAIICEPISLGLQAVIKIKLTLFGSYYRMKSRK